MKIVLAIITMILFAIPIYSQEISIPHAISGKCYLRCLDYETEVYWKEVDCDSIQKASEYLVNPIDEKRKTDKFLAYQKKLLKLGYKVAVNGILDEKTIRAHHKHLKRKKKGKEQ